MFLLTEKELDNAYDAISHHGYSTMLPTPVEWVVVKGQWDKVREAISKIDLDTYVPNRPMCVFAPKSRATIRIIHLLHPLDLIIYTALVLILKNDIEEGRVSKRASRVFSYRVNKKSPNTLYETKHAHDKYLGRLNAKSEKANAKFVALADIADFYPRIYQHRLENVIESVASSQRGVDVARVLVKKLISNLMGRNSYGIPVGPYASRVLAEAVLIDVDASLMAHKIDFVRWVDDYNIFCKSEYEAQSVLFSLGESLFSKHGLTLQSAKTKIMPVARYKNDVLTKPEEGLTDRDNVVRMLRGFRFDYEDDDEAAEPDEQEIKETLEMLQGFDLIGMLNDSLSDKALIDYEAVTYALTKLPRIPGVPEQLKENVLDLIIDNAELLYPVAEHIAKYVLSFDGITPSEKKKMAGKLIKPIKSKRRPPPDYYAMWILHIFSMSKEWNHVADILSIYKEANSEVVKRYAALAIATSGTRAEATAIKDDYGSASPLLQLSILVASRRLGKDERKHWKLSKSVHGTVEKLV